MGALHLSIIYSSKAVSLNVIIMGHQGAVEINVNINMIALKTLLFSL